mgnify:CR=1 FL=1
MIEALTKSSHSSRQSQDRSSLHSKVVKGPSAAQLTERVAAESSETETRQMRLQLTEDYRRSHSRLGFNQPRQELSVVAHNERTVQPRDTWKMNASKRTARQLTRDDRWRQQSANCRQNLVPELDATERQTAALRLLRARSLRLRRFAGRLVLQNAHC